MQNTHWLIYWYILKDCRDVWCKRCKQKHNFIDARCCIFENVTYIHFVHFSRGSILRVSMICFFVCAKHRTCRLWFFIHCYDVIYVFHCMYVCECLPCACAYRYKNCDLFLSIISPSFTMSCTCTICIQMIYNLALMGLSTWRWILLLPFSLRHSYSQLFFFLLLIFFALNIIL